MPSLFNVIQSKYEGQKATLSKRFPYETLQSLLFVILEISISPQRDLAIQLLCQCRPLSFYPSTNPTDLPRNSNGSRYHLGRVPTAAKAL